MKPFEPAVLPPGAFSYELLMQKFGAPKRVAKQLVARNRATKCFMNDAYQVNLIPIEPSGRWPAMIELSIKRRDKEPVHDWRDLQEIKNLLVGPEHEAVELYPAESRLVDTANQYFLFVLAESGARFPFGFTERMTGTPEEAAAVNAKQRRRPEDIS